MRKSLFLFIALFVACTHETDLVKEFVCSSWDDAIRVNTEGDETLIGLPYPYSVPCASGTFQEMYYWDTFFTNEGLLLSGRCEQARYNTENIAYLIDKYGFMPNGNRSWYLNRSQPPYFAMMVKAVYEHDADKQWLERMYHLVLREYGFWEQNRSTPCGLNRYSSAADEDLRMEFVATGSKRLGHDYGADSLSREQTLALGGHFAAEAESGWDFTPRFDRRCEDFCPVDLNANLYFYETFLAQCASLFGDDPKPWEERSRERKALMLSLMKGADGCFYDYDFVNNRLSGVVSGAVFNLLCADVLEKDDASAMLKMVLPALEHEHGLAVCAEGDYGYTYQWSYPSSWPPVVYLALRGLGEYGFTDDSQRLARKYVDMVRDVFAKTGNLWEKYNVIDGSVAEGLEYQTPPMLGWSAGAYLYCCSIIGKL